MKDYIKIYGILAVQVILFVFIIIFMISAVDTKNTKIDDIENVVFFIVPLMFTYIFENLYTSITKNENHDEFELGAIRLLNIIFLVGISLIYLIGFVGEDIINIFEDKMCESSVLALIFTCVYLLLYYIIKNKFS